MAEWCSQFVLSPAGADHGLQHCSNQINIFLCAVWEKCSCDLDIFVVFAKSHSHCRAHWCSTCQKAVWSLGHVEHVVGYWLPFFTYSLDWAWSAVLVSWITVDGDPQLCAGGENPAFYSMQVLKSSSEALCYRCTGRHRNNLWRVRAALLPLTPGSSQRTIFCSCLILYCTVVFQEIAQMFVADLAANLCLSVLQ